MASLPFLNNILKEAKDKNLGEKKRKKVPNMIIQAGNLSRKLLPWKNKAKLARKSRRKKKNSFS